MKNSLAVVSGCALLFGLLSAGGCVSQAAYDEAVAANRRANKLLTDCQDELRLAKADNEKLRGELADRDRTIKFQADQISMLTGQNNSLRADLAAAQKKLADLGQIKLPPLIPPELNAALLELQKMFPDILEVQGNMVKFKSDLTFDPGSAALKPQAAAALKKLADVLNMPVAKPFNAYVAGHTDDIPIEKAETKAKFEDNWGLSQGRAKAVVKALYGNGAGVAQERMCAAGFSKYHPVAPNAPGNKGNVLNRRVEIWIVPDDLLLSRPAVAPPAGSTTGTPVGD